MRLISLKIYKVLDGEVIRNVQFNELGPSFVCDEGNVESGSSVGKTAFIKCIDICLGAKNADILYKDENLGLNQDFKKYIFDNKISLKLTLKNEKGTVYVLERHLYEGEQFINNQKVDKLSDYTSKLKDIFFYGAPKKVSFRQLITKFIRLENEKTFKCLGSFGNNEDYHYLYSYFLNLYVNDDEQKLTDERNDLVNRIKKIKNKYGIRLRTDFDELLKKKQEETQQCKKDLLDTDYVGSFKGKEKRNFELICKVDSLTEKRNLLRMRINLLKESTKKEEKSLFNADETVLKGLYSDATNVFGILNSSFREYVLFHNEMCSLRKERYEQEIKNLESQLNSIESDLQEARKCFTNDFVEYKAELNDQSSSLYNVYFNSKKETEEVQKDYNDFLGNDLNFKSQSKVFKKSLRRKKRTKKTNPYFHVFLRKTVKNFIIVNTNCNFAMMFKKCLFKQKDSEERWGLGI